MPLLPPLPRLLLLAALTLLCVPGALKAQNASQPARTLHNLEHNGRQFSAYVDEKTGTPSWILDVDSLDFNLGFEQTLNSEAEVTTAAWKFLTAYEDVFGINAKQLVLERLSTNGELWFIGFGQRYRGLPVINAEVGFTVTHSGRLVAAGVQAFPDLALNVTPQLTATVAVQVARNQNGLSDTATHGNPLLLIVPEELEDRYGFKLAWQVRLDDLDRDVPVGRTLLVDAHTGSIIADYNDIMQGSSRDSQLPPFSAHRALFPGRDASALTSDALTLGEQQNQAFEAAPSEADNTVWGYVKLNYYETPHDFTTPLIRHTDQPFFDAKVTVTNDQTQQSWTTYADASGYYVVSGLSTGSHTVTFEIANQKAFIQTGLSTAQKKRT